MDLLRVGQKSNIIFPKEENIVEMTCEISDIKEDRLVLSLPQYFMRYINYLEEGNPLTVKIFSKLGTIDFNTVIISSPLEDEFAVELDYNAMKLTPSEEIPLIKALENLKLITDDGTEIATKTFEISTEYLKLYGDKKLEEGSSYKCELELPKNYGIIKFRGNITEADEIYDNEYKMTYEAMSETDRQNLLYYMYLYSNDSD